MEELEHIVYCERVGKPVLITVHKSGDIVSLCCHHEEGGRDCQHRAEPGVPCTENSVTGVTPWLKTFPRFWVGEPNASWRLPRPWQKAGCHS